MGFLSKIKNNMRKKVSRMPRRPNMIPSPFGPRPFGPGHPLFDPPRNQPRPIFPRRPREKGYKIDPIKSREYNRRRSEQEQMMQQFANPTIFGQPIGNFDFGNMPNFSIDDIMEMPQAPTQMPMPQDLPEVAPVGMMPQKRMGGMQDMEPRMMMSGGDEVFMDSSPEQMAFSIGVEIENLYKDYEEAVQSGDDQRAMMLNEQINDLEARRIEMMNQSRPQLAEGGEPFPDLSGDGETTFKDVLIGRGVKFKAEGGEMMMEETEMMAPGGDDIEASLMEVQGMQPEMQALDQYVQMVIQMIQAGASEAEVIESLRQAGLDDEDIAALFEAVMETMQGGMGQGEIDQELAQLS